MQRRTIRRAVLRRRLSTRIAMSCAAALGTTLAFCGAAAAAVLPATPSSFGGVVAGAQPGDVVALASGDYGTFNGAAKSGTVTIAPQAGAQATIAVNFNSARNLRLDGLTIRGLTLIGSTRDITVANSRFTGSAVVRTDGMVNANILFDRNTHAGIDPCGDCYEGRLEVIGQGSGPVGVTVQNSTFGPGGSSDGMQVGSDGVQILNNEFVGMRQNGPVHTDSLQLYGASNTVVRGNYFHDSDVSIMAPDGGRNEQIVDNVFIGGGSYRPAIQFGSHAGTSFVHNTVRNIDVFMDSKSGASPSRDGVLRDNAFVNGTIQSPSSKCSNCSVSFNLFSSGSQASGTNAVIGMPAFVGGAIPGSFAGYELAAGSPGKGNASDGTDRGARFPKPAPPPPAVNPAGAAPRAKLGRLRVAHRIRRAKLRRKGLRVKVFAATRVKVKLRLARKGARKALVRKRRVMGPGTRTFILKPRRARLRGTDFRRLKLRVRLVAANGERTTLRRTIRVRR
jgi:hypothetical protein